MKAAPFFRALVRGLTFVLVDAQADSEAASHVAGPSATPCPCAVCKAGEASDIVSSQPVAAMVFFLALSASASQRESAIFPLFP